MNVKELETTIRKHRQLYYNEPDKVEITDGEFDALVDTLKDLDPNSPVLDEVGAPLPFGTKFKHKFPMVSLEKVNTIEEFEKWVELNNALLGKGSGFIDLALSLKLDGVSFSILYKDGKFLRAATRGDGFEGEIISEHVKKMQNFKEVLPIKYSGILEIRGEMILTKDLFKKRFSKETQGEKGMKNARNAVSGLAKRHDLIGCEHIKLLYFEIIGPYFKKEFDKIKYFKEKLGLDTVPTFHVTVDKVKQVVPEFIAKREGLPYEIDGLVLKVDDLKRAKALDGDRIAAGHNPRSQVAFKFESEKKVTTLLNIEWSLGARGHVTPVAILKPTEFFGVTVQRASLSNIAEIYRLGLMIGDDVLVERANDVIPKVLKVLKKGKGRHLEMPTNCPECDSVLDVGDKFLSCLNQDCLGKAAGSIKTWVKNLGIKELGTTFITAITEKGIANSISDLYSLKIADLVDNIERYGEKSATKVLKNLHAKKEMPLNVFLGSVGIKDCSRSTFKLLVEAGIDTLEKMLAVEVIELLNIKGIAETTAIAIVEGLKRHKDEIVKLAEILTIVEGQKKTGGVLGGKSFQVTGTLPIGRKDWKALVEQNGGEVKSVSKKLDYLVTDDPTSGKNKITKALKLGIKVIDYDEFMELIK